MARKKFNFVSPSVRVDEIDNTGRPEVALNIGPVIVGRFERGPTVPTRVESFSEFIEVFGNPMPGNSGGDVWREGKLLAPTYAAYAAQAWLKNSNPLTVVRLLGHSHSDATSTGVAGWETQDDSGNATGLGNTNSDGGAYGLFLIDSGSAESNNTGALAAVWYLNQGSITLSGSRKNDSANVTGSAVLVSSIGTSKEFKAIIKDSTGAVVKETAFNFNENSRRYIRKVFNTNPTITNPAITDSADQLNYWLGETFEKHLDTYVTGSAAGEVYGVLLGLKGDSPAKEGSDYRMTSRPARTGWYISQDLQIVSASANSYNPENMTKLFRFHGLENGEWLQRNLKISIEDIKAPTNRENPYGTFTVVLRKAADTDNAVELVERFTSCTLNPDDNSGNYIAEKIGDMYRVWDDNDRRYREYGNYPNNSSFIRVEMNPIINAAQHDAELLPFGVFGPVRHGNFAITSGSTSVVDPADLNSALSTSFVKGGELPINQTTQTTTVIDLGDGVSEFSGSFVFPELTLRSSSRDGNLANPKQAYFGLSTDLTAGAKYDKGFVDVVRPLASGYDSFAPSTGETEYQWIFSLDDVSGSGTTHAEYLSGSRAAGISLTAVFGDYRKVLRQGFNKFTSPFFGGFDGFDITEKEPFRNTLLENGTELTSYGFNSIKRAIDSIADPEEVELSILSMPGLTNEVLTTHMINVCEDRRDCLAIIDPEGGYVPEYESTDSEQNRLGSYEDVVDNMQQRALNTSYAATYHPWTRIKDTISGRSLWAPASVSAVGALGYTEGQEELWFAPAGFTRGGLSRGNAGIPVSAVRERLKQPERDELYEANVNAIAHFVDTGIVIQGQKTLLTYPEGSALSRVNVRRLVNHIKKNLSKIAATTLFEPNIEQTWNGFLSRAEPFLRGIQVRFGLESAEIQLDRETTTADLVDRNIMYAKVYLVPTKAIEFIQIDLVINETGAAFDD